jgi:hypothetical protein
LISHCARPTRGVRDRALREHRRSTSLFPLFLETRYAGSLFLLLILLLLPPPLSVHTEDLGKLSTNPFNPDSTANPFGAGSPFKSDGINNPLSPYGSPFSNQSATNPFATDAPRLYDQQGNYRGKLSTNPAGLSGS